MPLLRSQKNHLHDLIVSTNYFSPSNFEIKDEEESFELYYQSTNFHFAISSGGEWRDFNIKFSPANSTRDNEYAANWIEILPAFNSWLQYLRREVSVEDKWARLFEELAYLSTLPDSSNTKFSHEEYLDIQSKFADIKYSMAGIQLLPEQLNAINSKLDHLLVMTTELNKFDWQNLFVGTIVSVIIQLGITPADAQLLYTLIKQAFQGLFLQ